jgi:protease-4
MSVNPPMGQGPIDPQAGCAPPPGMFPPPPGMRPPPPFFGPLLAFSLLLNFALFAMHGAELGGQQQIIQAGDPATVVAVVPLEDEINSAVAAKFDRLMTRVEGDSNVKALVVRINTPGGEVTASDEIYQRIQTYKSRKNVPVVVSKGAMATSGGYYASCAADHLVAENTTLTGNIGVLMPRFNVSKLAEKYGIQEDTIVASGATYKNAGSMFSPDNPRDDAYLQAIIDSAFARFKQVVVTGRASALKLPITQIADGRVYTAQRALSEGLVDSIGYLDDACQYAATTAHVAKPQIVRYEEKLTILGLFGDDTEALHLHRAASSGISVDGVTLDQAMLDRLVRPRLLYLWRP